MSVEQERIDEELSAYLDGELGEADARRVEQAVKADAALAAKLAGLGNVRELVRRLPRHKAPAGVARHVIALAEAGGLARRRAAWGGRLIAAAAVLVAAGIGVVLVNLTRKPSGTAPGVAESPRSVDRSEVVAKVEEEPTRPPAGAPLLAKAGPAGQLSFVINTDDLDQAQRDVEQVFRSNRLLLVGGEREPAKSRPPAKVTARANFYSQIASTPTQVRYEVVIAEDQLRRIVGHLNAIRSRQDVAQVPLRAAAIDAGAKELAMAEQARPGTGPAGRRGRRAALGDDGKYLARSPRRDGEKANGDLNGRDVMNGQEMVYAPRPPRPSPAGAPTTRPAEAVHQDALGAVVDKPKSPKDDRAGGLFAVLHGKVSETSRARQRLERGVASQPVVAQSGRLALPPTVAGRARRVTQAGSEAATQGRQEYSYGLLVDRQQQATTLAGANLRQLVVILNGVRAKSSAGSAAGR